MTTLASRRRTREPLQPTTGGERHAMADEKRDGVHRMTLGVYRVDEDGKRVEVITPPRSVAASWLDIPSTTVYPPCKCPLHSGGEVLDL